MLSMLARVATVLAIWLVAGALLFWAGCRASGAGRSPWPRASRGSCSWRSRSTPKACARRPRARVPGRALVRHGAGLGVRQPALLRDDGRVPAARDRGPGRRRRGVAQAAVALDRHRRRPQRARHAVRYWLERVAAPASLTQVFGVIWLALVVGAFFLVNVREQGRGVRRLLGALVVYALLARGFVALTYLAATTLQLGSHYDVSSVTRVEDLFTQRSYQLRPGSPAQLLTLGVVPQFTFWPIYTVITGLMGAGVAAALNSSWRTPRLPALRGSVEPVAGLGE